MNGLLDNGQVEKRPTGGCRTVNDEADVGSSALAAIVVRCICVATGTKNDIHGCSQQALQASYVCVVLGL